MYVPGVSQSGWDWRNLWSS